MHIGKALVTTIILPTSNRHCDLRPVQEFELGSSISYSKDRTYVKALGKDCVEDAEDNIDKKTWDEEDTFLTKAVSDYLPRAIKKTMKETELKMESFDLFHYALIVPSEWEEEMREDIIRPIFVQSGLISNEDHQDRLLFFSDIESIFYGLKDENNQTYSFERGQNTILCRISPDGEKVVVKFDLIQTTNTLFNFPNSKLFPKVMKSSSVFVNAENIEGRIKEFLRTNLFPVATDDGAVRKSLKSKLVPVDQDQIIEDVMEEIDSWDFGLLQVENEETKPCSWKLSEVQKKFIQSLCPSIIFAEIGIAFFGDMKDIISTTSFCYLRIYTLIWALDIHVRRSLNCITTINKIELGEYNFKWRNLLYGAGIGIFETIQHSDIYCSPRIMPSEDLNISSSVFLNSKPNAIINLGMRKCRALLFDISFGSTLFTCSLLNEDGSIQHIFNHNDFTADNLPPLEHFYTFSNTTTLNVKERFIPFAEKYFLGDLAVFIVDDSVFMKDEIKAILTEHLSTGEVLVSTNNPKYIEAFILMYMVYIKEDILNELPDHLIFDKLDTNIGYAVSIEAMLLNNTIGNKDTLQDIIFASGLLPKDDVSKKLRITTQGERILPAIQKSLRLEFTPRSYFLLCQLHEDHVQLSLHQVVTASTSEEKEQESIIVQDEILAIPNIYDSMCESMWRNLAQDSGLIELCEMHNTSDKSKIFGLFSSNTKSEFFSILRVHISDNVLQNNPGAQSKSGTYAVKLNNSCNCKVRLTTADIIDISFTPVLRDIACTLYASLLNKEFFGNYMNIDYLFSFIHFNNNPQLQYAFARILEEEADDFNLELGIDTCCLLVPELFSQLIRPVIAQRPLFYKDFKIGVLRQVYKMSIFKTMNYLENNETLDQDDNIHQTVSIDQILFNDIFKNQDVDVPVMISTSYIPYTSSLQFFVKIVGADTREEDLAIVIEASEPLTLTRF
ncbi:hypothetical protein MFLAVUS_006164 [Mucor flavus]|uniref:Uncharacterized protein n=1 Tax=Mucor flavus TaxID=439312 RepID=A0ABP9Z0U5_9FUNG